MRSMIFTLFAAGLLASPAAAAVIYSEDFEDGVFNGAVSGDGIGGLGGGISLFHVTGNFPASGNSALGFVRNETAGSIPNGTYAGNATGTIYSPEVMLPNFNGLSLNFDVANFGRGNVFFDRFDIGVFVGGNHFVRASTFPDYAGLGAQIYAQNNGYNSLAINIDEFIGQAIRVYIHYSVISVTGADFAGGRFDNLSITDETEVAVPEPGMVGLLGLSFAALAGARRRRLRRA
ncbi:MAG: PEP-CTERM sorting domain-containing protein [Sphingomonadaceae bacterium]|nr:PEP-CTERM sorting domain-containing protein [Sphingomonadaceae bacterium]